MSLPASDLLILLIHVIAGIGLIALATLGPETIRAAYANPDKSLRSE